MIYFETGHYYHMDNNAIIVRIHHKPEDGYPLAANGEEIQERMGLYEFAHRLVLYVDRFRGLSKQHLIDKVKTALNSNHATDIAHTLDKEYSRLLKTERLKLPQHYVHHTYPMTTTSSSTLLPLEIYGPDNLAEVAQQMDDDDVYYVLASC